MLQDKLSDMFFVQLTRTAHGTKQDPVCHELSLLLLTAMILTFLIRY